MLHESSMTQTKNWSECILSNVPTESDCATVPAFVTDTDCFKSLFFWTWKFFNLIPSKISNSESQMQKSTFK